MIVHLVGTSAVFAKDEELSSEVQVDMLMKAATMDLEAQRWVGAVESLEKAAKIGCQTSRRISFPVRQIAF